MALFLRPTRLASVGYRHLQDWTIVEDGRTVGRIIEDGSASTSPDRRWSWSIVIFVPDRTGIVTSGKAPTLSEAKADFRRNWDAVVGSPNSLTRIRGLVDRRHRVGVRWYEDWEVHGAARREH
jgi:hypothetical protein